MASSFQRSSKKQKFNVTIIIIQGKVVHDALRLVSKGKYQFFWCENALGCAEVFSSKTEVDCSALSFIKVHYFQLKHLFRQSHEFAKCAKMRLNALRGS